MPDQLSALKQHSTVVADTGDFASMRQYQPRDATTNPSLLYKAVGMSEYAELVAKTLADARQSSGAARAAAPGPARGRLRARDPAHRAGTRLDRGRTRACRSTARARPPRRAA
jgi:hypothetical protein